MSKEFKIGLITVVAGALLYYGFNYLRGSDIFSPTIRYYVVYPNVSGLKVSNPVFLDGLPVGRVSGFQLQQKQKRIVVALDIEKNVFVSDLDTAKLANDGVFGGKAVILDAHPSANPLAAGDTLKSDIGEDLLTTFEPVADNLNTTIIKLNLLLDQFNRTDIKGLVDTLKYSTGTITSKVNEIEVQPSLDHLNSLLASFEQRSEQLEGVLASSKQLMDSINSLPLGESVTKLNQSMDELRKMMLALQSEEGTVGKLINNDSVYNNLNKLLADLDELVIHFNHYPKDFLKPLGRKNKKLKGVSPSEGE